jgi:hypothetical protein
MQMSPSDQNSLVKEFYKHRKDYNMNDNEEFYFDDDEDVGVSQSQVDKDEYESARK